MATPDLPICGDWQMVRAELDGETAPAEVAQRTTLELTATHYAVRFAGEIADRGTVKLESDAPLENPGETGKPSPLQRMTLHSQSGPAEGRTFSCIYQRVGDRLRVCYGLDGTRPSDFTTRPGQQRYLATYRLL